MAAPGLGGRTKAPLTSPCRCDTLGVAALLAAGLALAAHACALFASLVDCCVIGGVSTPHCVAEVRPGATGRLNCATGDCCSGQGGGAPCEGLRTVVAVALGAVLSYGPPLGPLTLPPAVLRL